MIDRRVEAIFFDAVGTLLFPKPLVSQTYQLIAKKHGSQLEENHIRSRLHPAFEKQEKIDLKNEWRTDEDREVHRWKSIIHEVITDANSEYCFRDLWSHYGKPNAWTVHEDTFEVLTELQARGYILGMGSNFDGRLLYLVQEIEELTPIRDRCIVSSLIGWRKPSPKFFEQIAITADRDPSQILYIGDDHRNDYTGAAEAGMHTLLLDPDGRKPEYTSIKRLKELLA